MNMEMMCIGMQRITRCRNICKAGPDRLFTPGFAHHEAAMNLMVNMLSACFTKNDFCMRAKILAPGMFPSGSTSCWTKDLKKFEAIHGHEDALSISLTN